MSNKTTKRITSGIVAIIFLSICLTVTTFALVYSIVSVEDNFFSTGIVDIEIAGYEDGGKIIDQNEFLFEPGMTVRKKFYIENKSTDSVYYRLYFDQPTGGLADILEVSIRDFATDTVLFSGKPSTMTRTEVLAADDILLENEKRDLWIYFHYPEGEGNRGMDQSLSFSFAAEATQVRNNPNKEFN